jgi:elongation factor P
VAFNHKAVGIVTENLLREIVFNLLSMVHCAVSIEKRREQMLTTADFKRGLVIQLDGAPCLILDVATQSPSARGGHTLVKTKYRNLLTAQVLERTFKAGDKVDEADFERRKGQYLYPAGDGGVFMDLETYEQYELEEDLFAPVAGYLLEGADVQLGLFEGRVVSIDPPMTVELTVIETAPAIKHATATAQTKEAVLETGLRIQVPGYLESGERIKVDTRDGRFVSRA